MCCKSEIEKKPGKKGFLLQGRASSDRANETEGPTSTLIPRAQAQPTGRTALLSGSDTCTVFENSGG